MVLYNLADTYFVGMLNDPIQNAAVTLAAPVLLAFNAVNNLFGVGSSSMMSRAMDAGITRRYTEVPPLVLLRCFQWNPVFPPLYGISAAVAESSGVSSETSGATAAYLNGQSCGELPPPSECGNGISGAGGGSALHASVGTMSGCLLNIVLDPVFVLPWGLTYGGGGRRTGYLPVQLRGMYLFLCAAVCETGKDVCVHQAQMFSLKKEIVTGVCGVGIPASIQNLLNVTGMTVLNNFTSGFGSDAVAAMGISQKINTVPMNISMGLSRESCL